MTLARYFNISSSSSASQERCSVTDEEECEIPEVDILGRKLKRYDEREANSPPIKRRKFTADKEPSSPTERKVLNKGREENNMSPAELSQSFTSCQSQSSEQISGAATDDSVTSPQSKSKRKYRCRICLPCLSEDCEVCVFCKDKKKFGGPGRLKQACVNRKCETIVDNNRSTDSSSPARVKKKPLTDSPLLKCFNKIKRKTEEKTLVKSTENGVVESINYTDFIKQVKSSDTPISCGSKRITEIISVSSGSSDLSEEELKLTTTPSNDSRPRTPLSEVESLKDDHSNLKRDKTEKHNEALELYTTLSHIGYIYELMVNIELPKPFKWTPSLQLNSLKPCPIGFCYPIHKTDNPPTTLKNFFYQSKQCKKSTLNTILSDMSKSCPRFRARGAYNMLKTCRTSSESAEIWTSVYNPRSVEMLSVLGNDMEVLRIENWLSQWTDSIASSGNYRKTEKKRYKGRQDSSSEDEYDDQSARSSVLLITGPHGVGKSACVHMIADKLKYKVFEVNSSMLRTSRTVYEQFHESTQSQRVVNKQAPPTFFKPKKPSKSTSVEEQSSQVSLSKLSLILFDEVDVVFEADKGFYEAIQKLEQEARKPIVMTASNEWILHYLPKVDVLHVRLNPPQPELLCNYLTLISVVEGHRPNSDRISEIVNKNNNNIQQSIHQLQYERLSVRNQTNKNTNQQKDEKFSLKEELRKSRHRSWCDLLNSRKPEQQFTNRQCFTVPGTDDVISTELYNLELSDLSPYYSNALSVDYGHTQKIRETQLLLESLDKAHIGFISPHSFSFLSDKTIVSDYLHMLRCMSHSETIRRAMSRKKRRFTHHFDKVGLYLSETTIAQLADQYDRYLQYVEPEIRDDDSQTENRGDNSQSELSDDNL